MKLLVPVDGSATALRAIDTLVAKLSVYVPPVEVHLVNVQHAVSRDVGRFVGHDDIRSYHHEESMKALAPARAKLDAAGVAYTPHVFVGDAAEVIVQFAREQGIGEIIMGSHNRSELTQLLLGSVAREVLRGAGVPVTLVN